MPGGKIMFIGNGSILLLFLINSLKLIWGASKESETFTKGRMFSMV